jgi:hypothetical protein
MSNTRLHNLEVLPAGPVPVSTVTKRLKNFSGKGCILHVNVGTNGGGTVNARLQYVDPVSGVALDIPGASITAIVATNAYRAMLMFPGALGVANVKVDGALPGNFNVVIVVTVATVTSMSCSVDVLP